MKKLMISAMLILSAYTMNAEVKNSVYAMGYGYFYTVLAPHGTWIELDYGVVVWRPTVMRKSWAPYRTGRWLWTVDGWYWDSYEPFGYVVYHYGRWYYDDYYGWIWIPDYEWAPAWVEWRYDDMYIGWAPLPPYAIFSISIGIHFTTTYYTPYHHWHFVRYRYICEPYVYRYFISVKYKQRIYSSTKYRTNYAYNDGRIINRGVDIGLVRNRSGQNIRERDIQRISDRNEFERTRDSKNDDGRIRTFIASRDELKRNDVSNVEIKRSDRKSSLDVANLQLGERRSSERNDDKRVDLSRDNSNDMSGASIENKNRNENVDRNKNTDIKVDDRRNRIGEERKTGTDTRVQRNEERKTEVRTNTGSRNNEQNIKRNESNDRRTNTGIRTDTRKQSNTNQNRSSEIQRRSDNQVRTESRNQEIRRETSNSNNQRVQEQRRVEVPKQETRTSNENRRQEVRTQQQNNRVERNQYNNNVQQRTQRNTDDSKNRNSGTKSR